MTTVVCKKRVRPQTTLGQKRHEERVCGPRLETTSAQNTAYFFDFGSTGGLAPNKVVGGPGWVSFLFGSVGQFGAGPQKGPFPRRGKGPMGPGFDRGCRIESEEKADDRRTR